MHHWRAEQLIGTATSSPPPGVLSILSAVGGFHDSWTCNYCPVCPMPRDDAVRQLIAVVDPTQPSDGAPCGEFIAATAPIVRSVPRPQAGST